MIHLEVKSKLSVEKLTEKVRQFFGQGGLGLEIKEEGPQCLSFTGGGGYVNATLCVEEEGKTRLSLVSQEWDYQVKKFASELK
jgi:hypothetical protein